MVEHNPITPNPWETGPYRLHEVLEGNAGALSLKDIHAITDTAVQTLASRVQIRVYKLTRNLRLEGAGRRWTTAEVEPRSEGFLNGISALVERIHLDSRFTEEAQGNPTTVDTSLDTVVGMLKDEDRVDTNAVSALIGYGTDIYLNGDYAAQRELAEATRELGARFETTDPEGAGMLLAVQLLMSETAKETTD